MGFRRTASRLQAMGTSGTPNTGHDGGQVSTNAVSAASRRQ